jgi:hypothetical protein
MLNSKIHMLPKSYKRTMRRKKVLCAPGLSALEARRKYCSPNSGGIAKGLQTKSQIGFGRSRKQTAARQDRWFAVLLFLFHVCL